MADNYAFTNLKQTATETIDKLLHTEKRRNLTDDELKELDETQRSLSYYKRMIKDPDLTKVAYFKHNGEVWVRH